MISPANDSSSPANGIHERFKGGKVAVVLESSFLGFFAHAGFINSLLDSGVRPAKISGSSSGALVASAYACGMEQEELKDFILDRKLQRAFREWGTLLRFPAVFAAHCAHGLIGGHRVVKHLRKNLPVQRIEDTPNAELSIGVTNITRHKRQLIREGDMAPFIVASCAAAPVISSQKIDGEFYLDGGFTDGAPFEHWLEDDEIDTIIMHRIKNDKARTGKWSRASSIIACWHVLHHTSSEELAAFRLAQAEAAGKKVIVHETHTRAPGFIVSKKHSIENYHAAYDTWKNSPSLT